MANTTVTVQTIVNNSVSRRKDVDKTNWGDNELLAYLNKAIDNIALMLIYMESELAVTEGTVTLADGDQEYTLDDEGIDNFWAMAREGVYFADVATPLVPVIYGAKVRNMDIAASPVPTQYYITDDKVGLIPVPSAVDDLKCRYFAKPDELSLDDNMPYNNVFNEAASLFMDSIAALRDEMDMTAYQNARVALESLVLKVVKYRNPIGPKTLPEKG